MPTRDDLGGIVHSYQRYDPARIPSPRPADVDLVSPAMEHLLEFGELDDLTPEQLAAWKTAVAPVQKQWADEVKKRGEDPAAVMKALQQSLTKYKSAL